MKTCSMCKTEKPHSEFNRNKARKDGLTSRCKNCNLEYGRKWKTAHPSRQRQYSAAWNQRNKDQVQATTNRWQADNRDKMALTSHRRRVQIRETSTLTHEEWNQILLDHDFKCHYCGAPWKHLDHVKALSKGGTHSADNVVPACQPCNQRKSAKDVDEFLAST